MPVRISLVILVILFLSACQRFPTKSSPAEVEEINAIQGESIINITPLMKPSVKGLYNQATEEYQQGLFNKALETLKRAYQIQESPQVIMLIAEISLRLGDYSESFHWAQLATENGPSKGPICEKLWRILAVSAEKLGETPMQSHALNQTQECLVQQQKRY